jgi:hypothetical protein
VVPSVSDRPELLLPELLQRCKLLLGIQMLLLHKWKMLLQRLMKVLQPHLLQ